MAEKKNKKKSHAEDPREAGPQPPFQQKAQTYPGSDEQMTPRADHGQDRTPTSAQLAGKVALITGGESGIGRAVALAYAQHGANVLFSYLDEKEDARETIRLIEETGQQGIGIAGDIQDEKHCRKLVERTVKEFGQLDILVNNAAYQMAIDDLQDYTAEQIGRTYRTNVFAMFYLCKAAVPRMKPGASIINTTSIQAYDPSPNLLDYASTKSAIIGFTKALAKMVIEQGIRVNAVAPGPVWTPLIPATMPAEKTKNFGDNTLFDRPAQPAELAPVFVLLASDAAAYITAEVYGVTGGRTPY